MVTINGRLDNSTGGGRDGRLASGLHSMGHAGWTGGAALALVGGIAPAGRGLGRVHRVHRRHLSVDAVGEPLAAIGR